METAELDMRLQRYTAAEHRIGANLQELEQHSVYQLLQTGVLTGKTKHALGPMATANPSLWDLFTMLGSALEQARRLRGDGSRLNARERAALHEQLTTAAVVVRTEDIPFGERSLTGPSTREDRMTIQGLIDQMSSLYEPVSDVVNHAETVLRSILPRLNSAETTLGRLRTQAASLKLQMVELDRIDETIARVRDLSLTDPLSIPAGTRTSFDDAIKSASATIASARTSHDNLATDIAAASDLLDECRQLIGQANSNRSASLAKIVQPTGLRQPPSVDAVDGSRGLANRLDPILASTQPWQIVRRRLDEWSTGATRFRDQLTRVNQANSQPLQKRQELRGRLDAFRAKMAATGFSEDLVLQDLGAEAHNELFTSPTDLARAEKLVTEFGNRLATP